MNLNWGAFGSVATLFHVHQQVVVPSGTFRVVAGVLFFWWTALT